VRLRDAAHVAEVGLAAVAEARVDTGQVDGHRGHGVYFLPWSVVLTLRLVLAVLCAACVAALSACGLEPRKGASKVTVTVTRDFGARSVASAAETTIPAGQSLTAIMHRFFGVVAGDSARTFAAINGHAADPAAPSEWFYYVNGIAEQPGDTNDLGKPIVPANTRVHAGDQIWWDLHDPTAVSTIPAVVGSFPEPFVHGIGGKRYPTTLECAADVQAACQAISAQLRRDGVPVADQAIGTGSGQDTLAIVVATWHDLNGSLAGDLVAHGPRNSGVYAKFTDGGSRLQLLNPRGAVAQTLGAGAGLVAATNDNVNQPEWLITGTDVAGVRAAAASVTPTRLHDRFALAVHGESEIPVPVGASQ
jgi:hypothetical protein